MNDNDKVFIDTNILVYLLNEDSDFHEEIANRFESLALTGLKRRFLR